jgi:hypothetical protein
MERRKFIKGITLMPLAASAMNLHELKNITDSSQHRKDACVLCWTRQPDECAEDNSTREAGAPENP